MNSFGTRFIGKINTKRGENEPIKTIAVRFEILKELSAEPPSQERDKRDMKCFLSMRMTYSRFRFGTSLQ